MFSDMATNSRILFDILRYQSLYSHTIVPFYLSMYSLKYAANFAKLDKLALR